MHAKRNMNVELTHTGEEEEQQKMCLIRMHSHCKSSQQSSSNNRSSLGKERKIKVVVDAVGERERDNRRRLESLQWWQLFSTHDNRL